MVKALTLYDIELKLYLSSIIEELEIFEFYLKCNGEAENPHNNIKKIITHTKSLLGNNSGKCY
jgi:hypothetical protein